MGNFRFGPTLNLPGLKEFFSANPSRFAFDAVTTAQNSVEQDFTADESVIAGYGMFKVDFERWNLMAGLRLEATRADYAANELIFARRCLHRPHHAGDGLDRLRRRAARGSPHVHAALEHHGSCRVDQHARTSRLRRPGAHQHAGRGSGNRWFLRRQPVDRQRRAESVQVDESRFLVRVLHAIGDGRHCAVLQAHRQPDLRSQRHPKERRLQRPHLRTLRAVAPGKRRSRTHRRRRNELPDHVQPAAVAVRWARHECELHLDGFFRHDLRTRI